MGRVEGCFPSLCRNLRFSRENCLFAGCSVGTGSVGAVLSMMGAWPGTGVSVMITAGAGAGIGISLTGFASGKGASSDSSTSFESSTSWMAILG